MLLDKHGQAPARQHRAHVAPGSGQGRALGLLPPSNPSNSGFPKLTDSSPLRLWIKANLPQESGLPPGSITSWALDCYPQKLPWLPIRVGSETLVTLTQDNCFKALLPGSPVQTVPFGGQLGQGCF